MKWALSELNKFRGSQVEFDETVDLEQTLINRENTIISVSPIKVKGLVAVDSTSYLAHFTIDTTLILPSSRSLEPVEFPLFLEVDEVYMKEEILKEMKDLTEEQVSLIMPLEKDIIDLTEAVEDFILLNLPIQILTEAEKQETADLPKGDFWQVISEEDVIEEAASEAETKIDPRLAKLSELLDD